jgi:CDP-diacylglycerol--serine O-phosphatidyltransferase
MNQTRGRPQTFADREPMRGAAAKDRRRFRRGVYLLPSVFTLGNMFCGYACVVYSMRGEYETAAPLLAIALVLDALDGRIARLTGTESAFGVQFDSLADVISFGMAPAVLAFNWGLSSLGRLGWAAGFLFVTAGAMRLARFNIQAQADKRYFVGMPIPAAAAVPAGAGGARLHFLGRVDLERAAVEVAAVKRRLCCLGFIGGGHLHEPEALGPSGRTVGDEVHRDHFPILPESGPDGVLSGAVVEVADIQFCGTQFLSPLWVRSLVSLRNELDTSGRRKDETACGGIRGVSSVCTTPEEDSYRMSAAV